MRRQLFSRMALLAAIVGLSIPAFAQDGERPPRGPREGGERDGGPREEGQRDRGPRDGEGDRGGRFGGRFGGGDFDPAQMVRRMNPLFAAIDKDEDGSLSASEIEAAVAAIKSLDKDGNGSVSAEEVRPEFRGPGGPGGRPGFGPPGGDRGGREGGGPNPFVDRMKQLDTNNDGKLTKEELGERGERMLQFGDTNSDGVIDQAEIEQMARRAMDRGGRGGEGRGGEGRGGEGRGGEGRGDGDRPPREGDRPRRPEAE